MLRFGGAARQRRQPPAALQRPLWRLASRVRRIATGHRHRMAPHVSEEIERLTANRQLRIRPGEVRTASATDAGLSVELSDGSVMSVDAVVNCTGQETDLRRVSDPLITGLFESGTA